MTSSDLHVGFIGAGKMATALARGFIAADFISAEKMIASDVYEAARRSFEQSTGATAITDNGEVAARSHVLILAVKPQQMETVLSELKPHLGSTHLIVSIAAGVSLSRMEHALGAQARLVRVMPNTPALVGAGASGYALGAGAREEDGELVQRMLSTVGLAFRLPEPLLDAVTGLSGSGPAYGFQIIEALSDGGVRAGLPRDVATRLAAQTLLGAARMVLETGEHPAALKDAVTSPGGTTIAGLHELERGGLRAALINAVTAATLRSQELGRPS